MNIFEGFCKIVVFSVFFLCVSHICKVIRVVCFLVVVVWSLFYTCIDIYICRCIQFCLFLFILYIVYAVLCVLRMEEQCVLVMLYVNIETHAGLDANLGLCCQEDGHQRGCPPNCCAVYILLFVRYIYLFNIWFIPIPE